MKKLVIIGSYNASMFFKGELIPGKGETYVGDEFFVSAGGKGSNQAITAKMQNANILFIAKLGNDSYAKEAINMYKNVGLYSPSILEDNSIHTGVAAIFIDKVGDNSIMVVPGANLKLTVNEIIGAVKTMNNVYMAGFQLENDISVVCESIKSLHEMGIKTLLDPAPAVPLPEDVYPALSIIKPNEHEAALLSGIEIKTVRDAYLAGDWFLSKGIETAIITLGKDGTVIVNDKIRTHIPAPKVNAVDTTGAGDVFSGTLMSMLCKDFALEDAVRYANTAASLSVTKMGVFEAIPTEAETLEMHNALYLKDFEK